MPLNGAELYPPGLIERLEGLLDAGDAEGVLIAMFRELVEMPPDELDLIRAARESWAVRVANAPTLPREMRVEQGYRFEPDRFRALRVPTLLLVGGDSPPRELRHARAVADALADGRVVLMPGQQHAAMITAPDLFVSEVEAFLLEER